MLTLALTLLLVGQGVVDKEDDGKNHVASDCGNEEARGHRHVATRALALVAEERLGVTREVVELVGRDCDEHAVDQHGEGRGELEQQVPQADAAAWLGQRALAELVEAE